MAAIGAYCFGSSQIIGYISADEPSYGKLMLEKPSLDTAFTEGDIRRRIKFLLDEAQSGHPVQDQVVTCAMRTISNFSSVSEDASSVRAKLLATRMSREALKLKETLPRDKWISATAIEHRESLKQIWDWIILTKKTLTVDQIADRFHNSPIVVVTKEEDARLRRLPTKSPNERFEAAKIEVVHLENGKLITS